MSEQGIKINVEAEAGKATDTLREVVKQEQLISKATQETGQSSGNASVSVDKFSESLKRSMKEAAQAASIYATVAAALADIARYAKEAASARQALGEETRGLAANIGGENAEFVTRDINALAAQYNLGVAGRGRLIESVGALTDVRDGLSNQQIAASAEQLAILQAATGVSGKQAFDVMHAVSTSFNINDAEAVDLSAQIISSGVAPEELIAIAERTGDLNMATTLFAAKKKGLNLTRAARSIPTLMNMLDPRDSQGNLSPEFTNLGITDQTSMADRLGMLRDAMTVGQISENQFYTMLGGADQKIMVNQLLAAMADPVALQQTQSDLLAEGGAEQLIARQRESGAIRSADRARTNELLSRLQLEDASGFSSYGEGIQFAETMGANTPVWRRLMEGFGGFGMGMVLGANGLDQEAAAKLNREAMSREFGNVNFVNTQFNMNPNGTTPFTGDTGREDR